MLEECSGVLGVLVRHCRARSPCEAPKPRRSYDDHAVGARELPGSLAPDRRVGTGSVNEQQRVAAPEIGVAEVDAVKAQRHQALTRASPATSGRTIGGALRMRSCSSSSIAKPACSMFSSVRRLQ